MSSLLELFVYLQTKVIVGLLRTAFVFILFFPIRRDWRLATDTYGSSIETLYIKSSDKKDKSRKIKVYFHTPPSGPASPGSPKPVVVNWHGSGWVIDMHGTDSVFCGRMARDLDAYVIDADYRKAPEHPFPAALDDVKDMLDWVAAQPERFDVSRVAVTGSSAGGTMALIAASELRKSLKVDIKAVMANYPCTDLTLGPVERVVPEPIKPLPAPLLKLFTDSYVPDVAMRKDPRISPMYAKVEDFPPTVAIITCGGDTLAPEAKRLAEKLDDGSRKVVKCHLEGVYHGYDIGPKPGTKEWNSREKAHLLVSEALKESFKTS